MVVEFLAEAGEGADPEHADGAGVSVHALRDLVVRKVFEVPQHQHGPVILREPFKHLSEPELPFVTQGGVVGGCGWSRNQIAQPQGGVGEFLFEGDFACQVAFLRSLISPHLVGQHMPENPSKPGRQFGFARAAKSWEIADRGNEGLLDDVGGIEFGAEMGVGLGAGENFEPGLEVAEDRLDGGGLSGVGRGDQGSEGFRCHDQGDASPARER